MSLLSSFQIFRSEPNMPDFDARILSAKPFLTKALTWSSPRVMEHVFEPEAVYCEIWRTLRPSGLYLHTTSIYKERVKSARRAVRLGDGSISYLAKPEYHGNPIDAQGSLVTWHYGYDLPDLIARWTPFDVEVRRFNDRRHGIVAEFTEVIICKKRCPSGAGLGHA
jgi:hypothetical protein